MCSDPGQQMIIDTIKEKKLDGVIVAACSPTLHEKTFQEAAQPGRPQPLPDRDRQHPRAGQLGPHGQGQGHQEGHQDRQVRTSRRSCRTRTSSRSRSTSTGGRWSSAAASAGIQAALDIANHGYEVILVEKNPSIGGQMIQLSETFPTLDCSQCILTPKMVEVSRHPQDQAPDLQRGRLHLGLRRQFQGQDQEETPLRRRDALQPLRRMREGLPDRRPNEFDLGLSFRKAIYMPFPQAIPGTYTLDDEHCLGLHSGRAAASARTSATRRPSTTT